MRISFKIGITLAAVLCILAVIGAGNYLWTKKREGVLRQLKTVKEFSLLDENGKLFKSSEFSASRKMLLIFTSDVPTQEDVNLLYDLAIREKAFEKKQIQIILVSRSNVDTIKNFRKMSRFKGKLLLDPSGSVGRFFGAWPTIEKTKEWVAVLTDRNLKVHWGAKRKSAPDFAAVKEILN